MIELKRCPFCGDEVEIVPTGLYHWKYAIHHKSKTECILDANAFALPYEEEDAIRMWNTRADRKTESNSEKPNNCKYADNPSGDAWECGCFRDTYCEHQIYDRNPDGTINIVECGYEPKDEPQTDCGDFADRLAYERGVKHAWEVAQKVFDSTVTFYEAEDVAKQIDKDINVRSKGSE